VLNEIHNPAVNICTVEDPVEFNITRVNQFQVHQKIDLTFANVLRSLLRQDPDVIMLGEKRDPETARIAVQAALTGHLVLSTLHTNDSAGAVARLQNLNVEPYLISASLVAIFAQRLVRTICADCLRQIEPSAATLRSVDRVVVDGADRLHREAWPLALCDASCVTRQAVSRSAVTLVELLIVIVLIAIATTVAMPMLSDTAATRLQAAARLLAADLAYAQIEPIKHADDPCVVTFDQATASYSVAKSSAPATPVTNPATNQPYVTQFGSGDGRCVNSELLAGW
jgi:Tfp pilus assembly major pilin PilA